MDRATAFVQSIPLQSNAVRWGSLAIIMIAWSQFTVREMVIGLIVACIFWVLETLWLQLTYWEDGVIRFDPWHPGCRRGKMSTIYQFVLNVWCGPLFVGWFQDALIADPLIWIPSWVPASVFTQATLIGVPLTTPVATAAWHSLILWIFEIIGGGYFLYVWNVRAWPAYPNPGARFNGLIHLRHWRVWVKIGLITPFLYAWSVPLADHAQDVVDEFSTATIEVYAAKP